MRRADIALAIAKVVTVFCIIFFFTSFIVAALSPGEPGCTVARVLCAFTLGSAMVTLVAVVVSLD